MIQFCQILWPRKHHGGQLHPVHQARHPQLWISEPVEKLCCLRERELWDPQESGLWILDMAKQQRTGNFSCLTKCNPVEDSKWKESKPGHGGSVPVLSLHLSIHWRSPTCSIKSKGKTKQSTIQTIQTYFNAGSNQPDCGEWVELCQRAARVGGGRPRSCSHHLSCHHFPREERNNHYTGDVGGLGEVWPVFLPQVFSLNLARKAYELNMEKRRGDKLLFQVLSAFILFNPFSLSSTYSLPLSLSTVSFRCFLPLWPKHFSLKRQSLRRRMNQSRY